MKNYKLHKIVNISMKLLYIKTVTEFIKLEYIEGVKLQDFNNVRG